MQYWGFAWVSYSISLLSLLLYVITRWELFLEVRKIVDMFNLLLLLFGSYSFMHRRIPAWWYRFSLYLILLAVICIIYDFELLSFYLPVSVYQMILTFVICRNIILYWNVGKWERGVSAVVFFLWGFGKSAQFLLEIFGDSLDDSLLIEIILSNMVIFTILTIYISYARREISLTDDLYRMVVENSREILFYYQLKPEPSFLYVSPSAREMTGYSPNSFYQDPRLLFSMAAEAFAGDITDMFEGRMKRNECPTLELYRRDGQKFWCEFTYTFTADEDGNDAFMIGSMRDVTNLKTAEVEQVNQTRRRNILLSYISHELRTPITSIAGYLTAIQDGTLVEEDDQKEAMGIITSKTLTLKKLIDDLDQLAKFETNQVTFHFETCAIRDVTESLISRTTSDAEPEGFNVIVDSDLRMLDECWAVVDEERIHQVFSNLVTNAMKYSGDSRNIYLGFAVDDAGQTFVATIRDEGIGIKPTHISHIFDRFYRVKYTEGESAGGRGLGLTLSKEIIEAHQGEIFVESAPGEGSVFSFTLPLYQEA